ncbi:spore germination protein [Mangrovibacillus cuniculi]|uniref:Spore germination protein n=1 Tax=Mangrovibacillus cuniculi TaxID=2593652 RepID=A0A7S8HGT4_9BACI|nr:spore germination protein [Mangrovibacillus cuniculi]QPC48233.1 spore germination protein [Mangrovibacillus cuniculi]
MTEQSFPITDQQFSQAHVKGLFQNCHDVSFQEIKLNFDGLFQTVLLFYCDGLTNEKTIQSSILQNLRSLYNTNISEHDLQTIHPYLHKVTTNISDNEIVDRVFFGEVFLFVQPANLLYSVNLADSPKRTPEEPNTEVSIRGPRDGFIEDISTNVALIRKRIRTNDLNYEQIMIGDRLKNKVGLLYLKSKCQPEIVKDIKGKLNTLSNRDIDATIQLEELIMQRKKSLFPLFVYTGRPDFAAKALLNGRFVILLDGAPSGIVAPINFTFLLNTPEDANTHIAFVFMERIMRIFGFIFAIFLPGFWVAITSFHQDQIPYTLLATIVLTRQGVPFNVGLESIIMLSIFEIFREAGARLPQAIGQTLSVIGGLIIGQAAISAGLTAPGVLVVVGISVVSNYVLVDQTLAGAVTLLRFFVLTLAIFFGMFGFLISFFFIMLYLASLKSFNVPYLAPASPFHIKDFKYIFFRTPNNSSSEQSTILKQQHVKEENE